MSKRGGNRGRDSLNRRTIRDINDTARVRHLSWLDTGNTGQPHPNVIYRTTRDLELLLQERRDETAGTLREQFWGFTTAQPKVKPKGRTT